VPTIKNWLSILEASRIVYLLPPYFANLGKRIVKAPKLYFLDIGLVAHLTGIRGREPLLKGPLAGPLFENFCVQETVKIYLHRGERPPLFYLRTAAGLEVDLLVEQSFGKAVPVEIKLNKTPSASLASSLMKFAKAFPQLTTQEPILLSLADQTVSLTRQVTAFSLDDYLLWLKSGNTAA
jgi:uncharacterized protein